MWKMWGIILFIKIHQFNFCFCIIEYFYCRRTAFLCIFSISMLHLAYLRQIYYWESLHL